MAFVKVDIRPDVVPNDFKMSSQVVALARRVEDLGDLPSLAGWQELNPNPGVSAWTDDYSDILAPFLSRLGWFKKPAPSESADKDEKAGGGSKPEVTEKPVKTP